MRYLILVGLLFGCSPSTVVESNYSYTIFCIQGVNYVDFGLGATVMYNRDGTIKICSETK